MIRLVKTLSFIAAIVVLASCAASVAPGVGSWNVNISTPVGEQSGVWTFSGDGTGVMGSDQGDQNIEGVMLDGNSISFDVDIDAGGQSLSLSFSGMVDGDSLDGEFASDFGAFAVSGTRQ
ncbi:MAG: hypothetical protein O2971_06265 [Proteobacteria bacterium]|nr:hypothetical protein [Pseudomonadota bacterium]